MFIDGFVHQLPDIDPTETAEWLDSLDAVIDGRGVAGPLPARPAHGAGPRAGRRRAGDGHHRLHQHDPARAGAVVPGRRGPRAPHPRLRSAGTRWRWSTARTTASTASAATSRRTRRRPRSTTSASTTSSAARATAASATRSSSRATPRPASTRARSSRAASPRSSSTGSGARSTAAGCRATRTRGACPTSGSSRPCRWASARSTRSYQARFNRYLLHHEIADTSASKVWCFVGDGEMDEPESIGRAVDRGARAARQPDLRRQLQPAAPRRSGARQRQGHPGARGDVPRRGLERDQGDLGSRAGTSCSPATSTACSSTR